MQQIEGIFPILATPFLVDGELDKSSLERLIEFLMDSGAQGITIFGLAGEHYKLSDDERRYVQKVALEKTQGRLLRIVSITEHSAELARKQAREAASAGADALMVLPPFLFSPDLRAIRDHITEIARAVNLPICVQHAPNLTGMSLPPEFFVAIAKEVPNVRYVKVDSTSAGPIVSSLVEASGGRIKPLVGYARREMVDAFARGAIGCMPGCSFPEAYVEIYQALSGSNQTEAALLHSRVLPLINFMMQSLEFIIQCEKRILYWRGIITSDYCRGPSAKLTKEDVHHLQGLLHSSAPQIVRSLIRLQGNESKPREDG